jgi:hypothetical protein
MRARERIAVVVLLLAAASPATAQEEPVPPIELEPIPVSTDDARPDGRWWANLSAEFGWASARSWPDAVKLRPLDVVGQRIPSLTLPRNDTRHTLQMGFGFNGGLWLGESQNVGLDLGILVYPGPARGITGYSTGAFVRFPDSFERGAPIIVKMPEPFSDFPMAVPATASDLFVTGDLNLRGGGRITDSLRIDLLFGYRFAYLEDQVYLGTEIPGDTTDDDTRDFRTNDDHTLNRMSVENYFHGGQVGLEAGYHTQLLAVTWAAKLAYGGLTSRIGTRGVFQYPNMPVRTENETRAAFLPSFNGRIGLRVSDGVTLFAGYSFLYWDRVSRFGDAFAPGSGPIPGSPFWVQSVSLGFDLRF